MNKKTNKILISIIILLSILVIGLTFAVIYFKNENKIKDSSQKERTSNIDVETNLENNDDIKTDSTTEATITDAKNEDESCYATVNGSNSWENGKKISGQIDISIVNNSDKDLKNWTVKIKVPKKLKVDNAWNCEYSIKNNVLKLKPCDYNNVVGANQTLKDIGLIVTVKNEKQFKSIDAATLLVDGKKISDGLVKSDDNKSDDGSSEKKNDSSKKNNKKNKKKSKTNKSEKDSSKTPFAIHGKLSVDGINIVDSNGEKFQLKGLSTHGIAWFPEYVNYDTFKSFRDDWSANLIRLAMYSDENNGYCSGGDKEELKKLVCSGVDAATELGMYVIVDWHVLGEQSPFVHKDEAIAFFDEMTSKYKNNDNVIYEICNEPNGGTTWEDVKSYAEEVIPVIRKNCPDAIIIVGTPNWSQDVDVAADNPIKGYDNIMYAVHFYAATHKDNIRDKVTYALSSGLPIFISEFSICDASGNGGIDYDSADVWFQLINNKNLSYAAWNISNKNETSSLINSSCDKLSNWDDDELSETGIWIKNIMSR